MVPPWTPDPPDEAETESNLDVEPGEENALETPSAEPAPVPLAPLYRFRGTRRALGDYARSGDRNKMKRALGHYVRMGYGGAGTATRRFGGTARTAETLGVVLAGLATGQVDSPGGLLDSELLAGQTAKEIIYAIADRVRPVDGTLDAEAEKKSILDALSELLTRFPGADLLDLDAEQRDYVIKRFTSINVFQLFELDLGKTIQDKAPNASKALERLKEVKDYIRQSVDMSFHRLRATGGIVKSGRIVRLVRDVLKETFEVFESYVK